jgi:hypothetical protein
MLVRVIKTILHCLCLHLCFPALLHQIEIDNPKASLSFSIKCKESLISQLGRLITELPVLDNLTDSSQPHQTYIYSNGLFLKYLFSEKVRRL